MSVDIIYNRGIASKDMIVYNLMHEDDKVWEVVDLLSETGVQFIYVLSAPHYSDDPHFILATACGTSILHCEVAQIIG